VVAGFKAAYDSKRLRDLRALPTALSINMSQMSVPAIDPNADITTLATGPDPVDPQQLEDEIVTLLTGYLGQQSVPSPIREPA
jgi:hypothetical protein